MYFRSYGIMVGTGYNDNCEIWINRSIYFIEPRTKLNIIYLLIHNTYIAYACCLCKQSVIFVCLWDFEVEVKKHNFPPSSLVIINLWSCKDNPRTDNRDSTLYFLFWLGRICHNLVYVLQIQTGFLRITRSKRWGNLLVYNRLTNFTT